MIVHLMFDSHPLPYKKISLYKKKTGKNNKLINKLFKNKSECYLIFFITEGLFSNANARQTYRPIQDKCSHQLFKFRLDSLRVSSVVLPKVDH